MSFTLFVVSMVAGISGAVFCHASGAAGETDGTHDQSSLLAGLVGLTSILSAIGLAFFAGTL